MNQFKGLTILVLILAGFLAFKPATLLAAHGGSGDATTEMAQEAKDTGSDEELASVAPTAEDEQMVADSQHGK